MPQIPMSEIYADGDFNCRGAIAPIDVADLAQNIREHGLLSPIIVQPFYGKEPYKYRIIAGYRRHRALQINDAAVADCIVKENLSDQEASLINFFENLKREDLNILEEANAVQKLRTLGMTLDQVAKCINKSSGWVQIRDNLLSLPYDIQQEAAKGVINQNQIKELYSLRDRDKQFEAIRNIKEAKARGEKIIIKTAKKQCTLNKKQKKQPPQILEMIELLLEVFEETSLTTRVLAWVNGEVTDYELQLDIEAEAIKRGKLWRIPKEVHLKAKGIM